MSASNAVLEKRRLAIVDLCIHVQPGDTIYTVLRHVSRSGMYRVLDLYRMAIDRDTGEVIPLRISWSAAEAIGHRYDKRHEGLAMGGCGMDMGSAAVCELGEALFPDGFTCLGESKTNGRRCPANDHANGDRDYAPHLHKSGGYALRHRWI